MFKLFILLLSSNSSINCVPAKLQYRPYVYPYVTSACEIDIRKFIKTPQQKRLQKLIESGDFKTAMAESIVLAGKFRDDYVVQKLFADSYFLGGHVLEVWEYYRMLETGIDFKHQKQVGLGKRLSYEEQLARATISRACLFSKRYYNKTNAPWGPMPDAMWNATDLMIFQASEQVSIRDSRLESASFMSMDGENVFVSDGEYENCIIYSRKIGYPEAYFHSQRVQYLKFSGQMPRIKGKPQRIGEAEYEKSFNYLVKGLQLEPNDKDYTFAVAFRYGWCLKFPECVKLMSKFLTLRDSETSWRTEIASKIVALPKGSKFATFELLLNSWSTDDMIRPSR